MAKLTGPEAVPWSKYNWTEEKVKLPKDLQRDKAEGAHSARSAARGLWSARDRST